MKIVYSNMFIHFCFCRRNFCFHGVVDIISPLALYEFWKLLPQPTSVQISMVTMTMSTCQLFKELLTKIFCPC